MDLATAMAPYFEPANDQARKRLDSLRGDRVGIVGLGREGIDLARFLAPFVREIVISDRATADALAQGIKALQRIPATYLLGTQTEADLVDCDEIFVSPGVDRREPVVSGPAAAGVRISSATTLLFDLYPGPMIGVTGSSGKTTTTSMIGSILREAHLSSVLGGNIGIPMLGHLATATPSTWCVLELSSFQLSDLSRSPHVAVVLNIFPDHLDRHPDMDDYTRAKGNIVLHQNPMQTAVLNADDPVVLGLPHVSRTRDFSLQRSAAAWIDGDELHLDSHLDPVMKRSDLQLLGLHNVGNALAAMLAAQAAGCSPEVIATALAGFRPIHHRLEVVDTVGGVTYVNDSIATTPGRSSAALRAIEGAVVLIAGGRDKNVPMDEWAQLVAQKVRAVVLVGEATLLIRDALQAAGAKVPILFADRFADTVPIATEAARPGDVVLLSPACTSFDEFPDYTARGDAFRRHVQDLRRADVGKP